ncbi:nicotinate-nucleotide--dimethylbenzimidazole phosphoribosyltransferase [Nocardiopsis lucentensis]|uniref:nicotinate-nucleotide--dimethylbenzimidazole phosphoribosyltransferase n=1 Tax=Nocardiopsis lucentensis TaxID=53441 RepID=UPI00034AFA42|nr:nicotinate-nucleotide--dimethylbenzimidazole phosphoribosyltransferase [Nocardiopsis lucentensis]
MTNGDRGSARRDGGREESRERGGRAAPGLGGLLEGLPESGRGTQPRRGGGTNPFRQPPRSSAPAPTTSAPTEPIPTVAEPGPGDREGDAERLPEESAAPTGAEETPTAPDRGPADAEPSDPSEADSSEPGVSDPADVAPADVAPADTVAFTEAEGESVPAEPKATRSRGASAHAPTPADDRPSPNVIPFRGGDRAPAPAQGNGRDHGRTSKAAPTAAEPPARTTAPGPAEPRPTTTEAEQSNTVHAQQAAEPRPEPGHTGPRPQAATAPTASGPPADHAYGDPERAAVYRAINERRDVVGGFRSTPVPDDVLTRVLEAAHQAPSVGDARPWDFVVIDDPAVRARVRDLAESERDDHTRALPGSRARALTGLKVEAIVEAPLNIAVTVDPSRGGRHALGRHAQPLSSGYSPALAVENLWLAARAEGLGVGWISHVDERDVARVLDLPPHLEVVAYLCVGYVEEFPVEPAAGPDGAVGARPLSWAVHRDRYGRRGLPGQEPTSLLEETIAAIGALNTRAVEEARDRQNRMTKPRGSLGVLEEVSVRLAGLAGVCPPPIPEPVAVAVFAGDHGVHAQGVTPWPQEVTAQMVHNFLAGGAVVNAFAAQVGAEVTVVDVGVAGDLPRAAGLLPRKVARGTADLTRGPAMTREQALRALESGIEVARDLVSAGNRCLVTGDMGIANTTPAAALVCAFAGAEPENATGRGTGVDDATFEHKVSVVRRALAANPVDPADPIGTLAALGGLEHAALAGFVLGGAALGVPVLLDGVIAGSAALAAAAISPESVQACFAGHRSSEPGHTLALDHLGLRPLVDLEMRLGEGSGALLALPILQASARVLRDVATFDDAGVSTLD